MPAVIKLNSSGEVILRDGLPSCTCCETTIYVEHIDHIIDYPASVTSYFTMTSTDDLTDFGGMEGYEGIGPMGDVGGGPFGLFSLYYNVGDGQWILADPGNGNATGPADPTSPAGHYVDADYPEYNVEPLFEAYVSLTPLP